MLYKPWRRRIDRMRAAAHLQPQISQAVGETIDLDILPSHQPTKDLEQSQAIIHNTSELPLARKPMDYTVGGGGQGV